MPHFAWEFLDSGTGNDEAAWDVVQESWAAVAKGLQGLRDPGAFRSWIYTIATRAATNRLRRLRPEHPSPSEALDEHPAPEFTDDLERGEAVLLLRRAIARLPRESQVLIQLFYVEELSVRELARVLDVPVGTVKSRLHQARTKLKEILERTPS